jgi:hypothetical protein
MPSASFSPTPRRRPRPDFSPRSHFPRLGIPDGSNQRQAVDAARATPRRPGNRYDPHPLTGDPEYTEEEREMFAAILAWRSNSLKPFPTQRDLLAILKGIGYVKVPHGFKLVPIDPAEAIPPPPVRPPVPPLRVVTFY